jgi:hypothetical protein
MARKPTTPARPAPTAAFACDAAPVDSGRGAPVAVREPDRVAEWTAEMEVLFEPVGIPVALAEAAAELELELTTGVVVASAAAGYIIGRMLLTSAGIEAYQPGVLPAARDEPISAA